jgi:hypothetical protein
MSTSYIHTPCMSPGLPQRLQAWTGPGTWPRAALREALQEAWLHVRFMYTVCIYIYIYIYIYICMNVYVYICVAPSNTVCWRLRSDNAQICIHMFVAVCRYRFVFVCIGCYLLQFVTIRSYLLLFVTIRYIPFVAICNYLLLCLAFCVISFSCSLFVAFLLYVWSCTVLFATIWC